MESPNDPELALDLSTYLPLTTREALRVAIDAAYVDAGRHFEPDAGADMQLFGFTVFKYVAHQVRRLVEADPSLGLSVMGSTTGAFRLKAGPLIIAPYSCGHSSPTDPSTEFPGNDKGAGLLANINSGQIEIFDELDESPTAVVLAHYGNPTTGLEAVFLKKPVSQTNGRISRWGHIERVFQIGDAKAAATEPVRETVLPAPAPVKRPTVLPFRKRPVQTSEGEGA